MKPTSKNRECPPSPLWAEMVTVKGKGLTVTKSDFRIDYILNPKWKPTHE
jgi:hypothetical protein